MFSVVNRGRLYYWCLAVRSVYDVYQLFLARVCLSGVAA